MTTDPLQEMIDQHMNDLAALQRIADSRKVAAGAVNPLFKSIVPTPSEPAPAPSFPARWPDDAPEPLASDGSTMPPIERWADVLFKPGYAQAMLYVLMPTIESVVESWLACQEGPGRTAFDYRLLGELNTWTRLTIAQRQALTDLFRWVDNQLASTNSVIPESILANLAAAAPQD
jgi:hypothetical protein